MGGGNSHQRATAKAAQARMAKQVSATVAKYFAQDPSGTAHVPAKPEPKASHRIHYWVGGVGLLFEALALMFGISILTLGAALLFWFALWDYRKERLPNRNETARYSWGFGICSAIVLVMLTTALPFSIKNSMEKRTHGNQAKGLIGGHAESIRPHLQTQLVIDSVPQGTDIEFHIEVENISKLQVNGLRAGMRTAEMTSLDVSLPLPPSLPPGGRLSIPGNPVSGLKRSGALFLDLNYESKVDSETNKFISSYSFLLRPVDMKPQALLPITWQEQAGVILGPEQQTMEAALKTLAGPQGTMLIALPLRRPDGSPSLLVMTNNKRRFSFDGASRSISFTTTASMGSLRTISHALPGGSYEAIAIGCLWDDQKDEAKLIIGGNQYP